MEMTPEKAKEIIVELTTRPNWIEPKHDCKIHVLQENPHYDMDDWFCPTICYVDYTYLGLLKIIEDDSKKS